MNVLFLLLLQAAAAAVTFDVPTRVHTGSYQYAPLDPAPVGISFEFFAFPSYFTNVSATRPCLDNWRGLTGVWPPIRVGGTTQDRARYDAGTDAYVVYAVASPADAPASLTFGPRFLALAAGYGGSVVVGLNRGRNDLGNTVDAARAAVASMGNLLAVELGNEPEYYSRNSQPIAQAAPGSPWTPAADAASQNDWALRVGAAVDPWRQQPVIQAGNSNDAPPTWGAAELIATQNASVKAYVQTYAHHNYPGGSVSSLMSHRGIVSNLHVFDADVAAAVREGKPYVFGETNSVSGGGAANVSPTFGAALWTMDYVLRASYSNISRTYFHHGTVGNCQYCFWGRYSMGAPWYVLQYTPYVKNNHYGAYAATALLAQASHLTALDDGTTNYAAYVTFDEAGAPLRALLYNSDYFAGSGSGSGRSSQSFELTGLVRGGSGTLRAKRLTAESASSRVDQGGNVSFGGQTFTNGDCLVSGDEVFESLAVTADGRLAVDVKASEALLVYLQ
ncbi:glycoside hydrolase family 79 protein [Xylariomycetidae sp. FL2044]|nr:glycoside hydrolase family 79 protein [Xylariomycetidae sp. FL2044]